MATVTTTITPTQTPFPFSGYTEPISDYSGVARGEIRFSGSATVAAPGAGNNQQVTATISPDPDYAWVLHDLVFTIAANTGSAVAFPDAVQAYVTDGGTAATRSMFFSMEMVSHGLAFHNALPYKIYSLQDTYHGVVLSPYPASTPALQVRTYNTTANDVAYTAAVDGRIIQYDISQAHHLAVNSPIPTR